MIGASLPCSDTALAHANSRSRYSCLGESVSLSRRDAMSSKTLRVIFDKKSIGRTRAILSLTSYKPRDADSDRNVQVS